MGAGALIPRLPADIAYRLHTWYPFARLRTEAGRHRFTVKRPVDNELSCVEYETEVADREAMHHALLAMGFRPTVRIHKVRRTARRGNLSLCLEM